MPFGLHPALLSEAALVGIFALLVARRAVPLPLALGAAFVKIAIPVMYFAFWYSDAFLLALGYRDPFSYLESGITVVESGYHPFELLVDLELLKQFWLVVVGSIHVLYGWVNAVAVYYFGPYMFAPVLINVGLTFVGANGLLRIAELCGFDRRYQTALWIFFLFHYEVLIWSSFINLKDTLVQVLIIIVLLNLLRLSERFSLLYLGKFALGMFLLIFLRFYIPVLVLIAFVSWAATDAQRFSTAMKVSVGAVLLAAITLVVAVMGTVEVFRLAGLIKWSGAIRGTTIVLLGQNPYFLLQDWDPFVFTGSIMHLTLLLPALGGAILLWRERSGARPALICAALIIILTGAAGDTFWPVRARYQIAFVIAWAQFHFLWRLVGAASRSARQAEAGN